MSSFTRIRSFAHEHRGIVADLTLFVVQLLLMQLLVIRFDRVVMESKEEFYPKVVVAGFFLALCFLQPVGVLLKRYRMSGVTSNEQYAYGKFINDFGCYYLVSQLVLMGTGVSVVFAIFGEVHVFDKICFAQFVIALALSGLNLWIVFLYGKPPIHRPLEMMLGSPQSEFLGDCLLILNLILWQVLWGYLMFSTTRTASSVPDALIWLKFFMPQSDYTTSSKLGWFFFSFVIFYLSPRYIYLVHDSRNRLAWLTILLANSPVFYRILFGR